MTEFLEGNLSPEEWRAVEEHLHACPGCAEELREFRRTVGAVRSLPLVPAPPEIPRRVRAEIDKLTTPVLERQPRARAVRRRVFTWQAAVAGVAAVLLIATLALYGVTHRVDPGANHVLHPIVVNHDSGNGLSPHAGARGPERDMTRRSWEEVTLGEAAAAVMEDTGIVVTVEEGLSERIISVDFSSGVPGYEAAARLAKAAEAELLVGEEGYRIVPQ